MNRKDMKISKASQSFTTEYSHGAITRSMVTSQNTVYFEYIDGSYRTVNVSTHINIDLAYIAQFGLSVTETGTHFFVQSWEHGLFCFDACSGTLVWYCNHKKAHELIINQETVVCRFHGYAIAALDIYSGTILKTFPIQSACVFLPINDSLLFIGPKRGQYLVLDSNMNEVKKMPVGLVNPEGFPNFIIKAVDIVDENLSLSCVGYTNEALLKALKEDRINLLVDNSSFVNNVPFYFP